MKSEGERMRQAPVGRGILHPNRAGVTAPSDGRVIEDRGRSRVLANNRTSRRHAGKRRDIAADPNMAG